MRFSFDRIKSVWEEYHELLLVLIIWLILMAISLFADWLEEQELQLFTDPPDISYQSLDKFVDVDIQMSNWLIFLTIGTYPIAIFVTATNDRLSLPIRLLAIAECFNRFLLAFLFLWFYFCHPYDAVIECSELVNNVVWWSYFALNDYYPLDISQFCQTMISASRFMALSFNGLYFHYTLKWPLIQLILPYLIVIGSIYLGNLSSEWVDYNLYFLFQSSFSFLACSLDFVTNRNLKKLKNNGKASKAEVLLMIQMIASSSIVLINMLLESLIASVIRVFFGSNVLMVFLDLYTTALYFLNFLYSIIVIIFLRKPKEKSKIGKAIIVSTTQSK